MLDHPCELSAPEARF